MRRDTLNLSRLRFNRKHVKRAPRHRWPMGPDGRLAWPSYPTPEEVLLGGPQILWSPAITYVDSKVSRRNLDLNDPRLLNNVLGIRADLEVPLKYLAFFEYRWNFLILARRDKIPRPLRKFLLGLWHTARHNLWLRRPVCLTTYARLHHDRG